MVLSSANNKNQKPSAAGSTSDGMIDSKKEVSNHKESASDEDEHHAEETNESEKDEEKESIRIPLHRLMLDYEERKAHLEKERKLRLQQARRSARQRRAPQAFVAEPASIKKPKEGGNKRGEEEDDDSVDFYELVQTWKDEEQDERPILLRKEALDMVKFSFSSMVSLSRKQGRLVMPRKQVELAAVVTPSAYRRRGITFPEQLMLLLVRNDAPEGIWWLGGTSGKVFAVDVAFFVERNMSKFFPSLSYKRITCALKRWGFQRSSNHQLPDDGSKAYFHPSFRRDRPEQVSHIKFAGTRHSDKFIQKRRAAERKVGGGEASNAKLKAAMSKSMSTEQQYTSERSRYPFLYPEESRAHAMRQPQQSSPVPTRNSAAGQERSRARARDGGNSLDQKKKAAAPEPARSTPCINALSPQINNSSQIPGRGGHARSQTNDIRSPSRYSSKSTSTPHSTTLGRNTTSLTPPPVASRGADPSTSIVTPNASRSYETERDEVARGVSFYLEEDERLQRLIAEQLMKASKAKRWSPLDVLATREEIERLTAERARVQKLASEGAEVLRQYRALDEARQKRQREAAEEERRRKRQRLLAEEQRRVDNDEAARRQRLANALFGTTATTIPSLSSAVRQEGNLPSANANTTTPSSSQSLLMGRAANFGSGSSNNENATSSILDTISRLRQNHGWSSQAAAAALYDTAATRRQAVSLFGTTTRPSVNQSLSYDQVLTLQRLANAGR